MKRYSIAEARRSLVLVFCILAIAGAFFILPRYFPSEAGGDRSSKTRTGRDSSKNGFANYDIRLDKKAFQTIASFRSRNGRTSEAVADLGDKMARGEESLRDRIPSLKIEYNAALRTPEVITPDVKQGPSILAEAAGGSRANTLLRFLRQNNELVGTSENQVDELKVFADYANPDGNLSFVELNQEINSIPVFRGHVKAGFKKNGEMFRVINNLAPGLSYESISTDFGDPANAVRAGSEHIGRQIGEAETLRNEAASTEFKSVFGEGDWATTAEKMYFPTEPAVAVPAWRVLIWEPVNAYYVIVDAETGALLWRKNITDHQTQSATYNVYANSNSMIDVADSPAPLTPGPIDPALGTQGAILARTDRPLIGNEGVYSFNNNGWITDGNNTTDGNAVESGLDLGNPNGVDAATLVTGVPNRTFTSTWNPPPGNPAPGEVPSAVEARRGAVIQMFYIMNRYHDEIYRLGFTEAARNFQHDNFGRGGTAGDRISAEGQDFGDTNNANFATGPDGLRGRMQMYVWDIAATDRDGTADADIIVHEVTHGTSNRLHGNASGLLFDISGGMGEGWSDFYAHAMLSEPGDPINGVYAAGGYVLFQVPTGSNYYYGVRRFPKAVMAFTGGPQNRPHNPLTFADIDSTQANLNDGAFAPAFGGTADQVHNSGEIWSSALWEIRAKMIQRLGWAVGNRRVLQLVTDGMKISPLDPTFLTGRDAIIAAAQATGDPLDVADVWAGFAIRGMGASASIQDPGGISSGGTGTTRVTEAFDLPNLSQDPVISISDSTGDNDGFPEPGEPVVITVPLSNRTGNTATGVSVQLVGGGSAAYGSIAHNGTASNTVTFTIPQGTQCGGRVTLTFNVNSSFGPTSFTRTIIVGVPTLATSESFDSVTAPAIPAGWAVTSRYAPITFVSSATGPDTAPNAIFAPDLPDCVPTQMNPCPTEPGGDTDLTSPPIRVTSASSTVTFRNRFNTEFGWDGGVLEISINGSPFVDILAAGGAFTQNGYNFYVSLGQNNPLGGRSAWTGNSGGYVTTIAQLPASANGKYVELRWRFGTDSNTAAAGATPGWNIDGISLSGAGFATSFSCSFSAGDDNPRADFDGDGRTDISVFRPSERNWYVDRSTDGFLAVQWGLGTDEIAPGDYDGDGMADFGIFRPGAQAAFYILHSADFTFAASAFGTTGDQPVVGDYDGDGSDDVAVWRPSEATWFYEHSTGGGLAGAQWGQAGDKPVPGDYDADGTTDFAIYRDSGQWWILRSTGGHTFNNWGLASDRPVPADYDGDNKDDIAIFRPENGTWWIIGSLNGQSQTFQWGANGDIPVPGDYDGDNRYEPAIFRDGDWYILKSTGGFASARWGLSGDIPVPAQYLP